ncbi:plant expansin [Mycena latifolia]|nr:plant expansin [Mycena latifolia]
MSFHCALLFVLASMLVGIAQPASVPIRPKSYSGDGTYYDPGVGACGKTNTKDQLIVAVGQGVFDSFAYRGETNSNKNPICGKKLKATYKQKSVTVVVEDLCAGCPGDADLDFTIAGFTKLAASEEGRIHGVTWEWV